MELKGKIFQDTGWLLFSQFVSMTVGFIAAAVVARTLGPEGFGLLAAALALVGLLAPLSQAGIDAVLTKELINFPEHRDEWLTSAWVLRLSGALVAFAAAQLIWPHVHGEGGRALLAAAAFGPMLAALAVTNNVLASRAHFARLSVQNATASFLGAGLRISAAWATAAPIWVAVATSIQASLAGLICSFGLRGERIRFCLRLQALRKLATSGSVIMLAQLLSAAYMRLDQLMITSIRTTGELGHYAVAARSAEMLQPIPLALLAALTPRLFARNTVGAFAQAYRWCLIISIALASLFWLVRTPVVIVMFGNAYVPAIDALEVLLFATVPAVMGTVVGRQLIALDKSQWLVLMTAVGLITNVGLNLLWIPAYGITGAAWATLISYSLAAYSGLLIPRAPEVRQAILRAHFLTRIKYLE